MAKLGFRNSWPTYRRERGDYVEPFVVGNPKSNWDSEKKVQRLETAQAVAASNKAAKVKDRGGKPLYLVELDSLFVQLEKVQARSRDELLRHRAKTALVDLARLRSKLSTMATVGKKPVVSLSEDKVVKPGLSTPSKETMAALTRREVVLFRARWASLLS